MREEKIQLKTIKLETLNAECLMAANRCVRYLRQNHRVNLQMQDKEVLTKISKQVRTVNDVNLNDMYKDLKEKMVDCVSQAREAHTH